MLPWFETALTRLLTMSAVDIDHSTLTEAS
jgi:hypothetical protein